MTLANKPALAVHRWWQQQDLQQKIPGTTHEVPFAKYEHHGTSFYCMPLVGMVDRKQLRRVMVFYFARGLCPLCGIMAQRSISVRHLTYSKASPMADSAAATVSSYVRCPRSTRRIARDRQDSHLLGVTYSC